MIKEAQPADIEAMLGLAAAKREASALYHPVFHRPAENARDHQRPFFQGLLSDPEFIVLVHRTGRRPDGFIVGHIVKAPPVYDPGGLTCIVDDFVVENTGWDDVGLRLLNELRARARKLGAVQLVVVVSPQDHAKRRLLLASGLGVVSEWTAGPI